MATAKKRNSKFIVRKSKKTGKTVRLYGAPMKKVLEAERARAKARARKPNSAVPATRARKRNAKSKVVRKNGRRLYGAAANAVLKQRNAKRNKSSKLEKLLSVAGGDRVARAYDIVANPEKKKRNLDHRDADHPIEVRRYWQGRKGYKTPWQRAHEAGQQQLFRMNPGKGKKANPYLAIINSSKRRKGKRRNSGDGLYETFHGEDVRSISTDLAPDGTPNNVDILGRIDCIYFQKDNERIGANGKTGHELRFGLDGEERPKLASNRDGSRYFIVGNLTAFTPNGFFGPATRIEYTARKPHIEGHDKPVSYWHKFGEENGIRPTLETDHDGLLVLKGGDYRTTADGIIN